MAAQDWQKTTSHLLIMLLTVNQHCASYGFSELTQNWIRSSYGHSTPCMKISCKSVQLFSCNLADKEINKQTKKSIENNNPGSRVINKSKVKTKSNNLSKLGLHRIWLFQIRPKPNLAEFRNSNSAEAEAEFGWNLFSGHRTIRQW